MKECDLLCFIQAEGTRISLSFCSVSLLSPPSPHSYSFSLFTSVLRIVFLNFQIFKFRVVVFFLILNQNPLCDIHVWVK